MKVSIVIPTYNGESTLPSLLKALEAQTLVPSELIAVDSSSDDRTPGILEEAGFKVFSIRKRDFNHGSTRDMGISMTNCDVVVLLVQDAIPAGKDYLSNLVSPFEEDPLIAGVYGRQIPRPGCNPIIEERLRNWNASRSRPMMQEVHSLEEFNAMHPLEKLKLCAFDNVASAVKKSVWEEFKFGYRAFGEDVAWAKRVLLQGYKIFFQASAKVIHSHNRSPFQEFKRLYCDHQNLNELFQVTLVPTILHAMEASEHQRKLYKAIIKAKGFSMREASFWNRWAEKYALLEALGIWLGARSSKWKRKKRPWFPLLDRLMRKGI